MKLTDKQITLLIAGVISVAVLGLRLAFGYNNGFDWSKDPVTIFTQVTAFVMAIMGGNAVTSMMSKSNNAE